jgi:DNA-binding NarL/FixJ family response regulator
MTMKLTSGDAQELRPDRQEHQDCLQPPRPITGRHVEILELMAVGASAKEAAHELGIAEQTVKNQLHEIYQRLEARSCAHAVALAIASGYVHIDAN